MNELILTEVIINRHILKKFGCCANCSDNKTLHKMRFIYAKNGKDVILYYIYLCLNCYEDKIEYKPLNELNNFIPLLRMKGRLVKLVGMNVGRGKSLKRYNISHE